MYITNYSIVTNIVISALVDSAIFDGYLKLRYVMTTFSMRLDCL
jgi:hypothetical protein